MNPAALPGGIRVQPVASLALGGVLGRQVKFVSQDDQSNVDAGYAINPARDLGPRLFTYLEGWGPNAFPGPHGYWWVPILGPLVGGAIAPFIYDGFIGATLKARGSGAPQ